VTAYLGIAQILHIHRVQITRFGGSMGLRDRGGLESAIARPQMTFGGEDLYPEIPDKAAALMHSLVMNHPFIDGNKRVGAHTAIAFLIANGFAPEFSPTELVTIALATARGEMSAEALAIWIRQRSSRETD
jgi:death on curing protein